MFRNNEICLEDLMALIPDPTAPSVYQYYEGLKKRRIIFNKVVDADIVEQVIIPLMDMDSDESGDPIEIILATPGGSTFDSLILCNIIDNLKTPTTIRVMGYAFSMGGLFLCAGYNNPNVKKVCYPFSAALLHAGNIGFEGSANAVKDTMKFNDEMNEKIREYVLSHSKITEEEYEKMERCEWYMCAEKMLELGLVDEIIE